MIFFVIKGNVRLKINDVEAYSVFSNEMFMAQSDNLYEITMMEQTHLLVCHIPIEVWYDEQKWIDGLISDNELNYKDISEDFFKLPVKKAIIRYLSLLDFYLKDGIHSPVFYEMKRKELFFLLFSYYQKTDLAQFLQCVLSKDIQFRKFVTNNYLHVGNVQDLAKLANYSTSGFIKKFQKCFNETPYNWMQRQKAKQILLEFDRGTKSLQELANEFNFSSYQHFSAFCKTHLGAAPTKILKKRIRK